MHLLELELGESLLAAREIVGDGDLECGGRLRDRIAESDDLLGTADSVDALREGHGPGIHEHDAVESHHVGDAIDLIGRREPDRGDRARQVGGRAVQCRGGDLAPLQGAFERQCLVGVVDECDLPVLGQLPREQSRRELGVGVVDEPEVFLEPVEHRGVGAEQSPVTVEQRLERRLPPGQLQFIGDPLARHVTTSEVGHQLIEFESAQHLADLRALLQVAQHIRLRRELGEALAEFVDRQVDELFARNSDVSRAVERREVLFDALPGHLQVGDAGGDLGWGTRGDEPLPHHPLLLNAHETVVQIADVHPGAHILFGEPTKAAAIGSGHLRRTAA